ncbi:MAG: hypothetical protein LLG04_15590 [Parachlamydia sp.]|nr:hypothetical protein [Parachlamydia sp.]
MARYEFYDGVFLHNFFKDRLEFFTREQPRNQQYWDLYCDVTDDWLPLKSELSTYHQIPVQIKNDLIKLFDIADQYVKYAITDVDDVEINRKMKELWHNMHYLAIGIRGAAKNARLYTDGLYSSIQV